MKIGTKRMVERIFIYKFYPVDRKIDCIFIKQQHEKESQPCPFTALHRHLTQIVIWQAVTVVRTVVRQAVHPMPVRVPAVRTPLQAQNQAQVQAQVGRHLRHASIAVEALLRVRVLTIQDRPRPVARSVLHAAEVHRQVRRVQQLRPIKLCDLN